MIFAGGYNGYSDGQLNFYSESFLNFHHFTSLLRSKVPAGTPIFVSGTIKPNGGRDPYVILGIRENIENLIADLLGISEYGYNLGETANGDLTISTTLTDSRMSVRLRILTKEGAEAYKKIQEFDTVVPPNSVIRRMSNTKRTKPIGLIAGQRQEHMKVMEQCFAMAGKRGNETLDCYRKEMAT